MVKKGNDMLAELVRKTLPPPDYRLRLPEVPLSDNYIRRQYDRGRTRSREVEKWTVLISNAMRNYPIMRADNYRLILAEHHYCDKRRRDPTNAVKTIEDGAVHAGLLHDDAPLWCDWLAYFSFFDIDRKKDPYTWLLIWEQDAVQTHMSNLSEWRAS